MGILRKTRQMSVVRVSADILKDRLAEKEQREAADDRNDVQRWLGDPPVARSALAQHKQTAGADHDNR